MAIEALTQTSPAKEQTLQGGKLKPAHVLSGIVAILAASLAATGLASPKLYGGAQVFAMAVGNDLVTLVAAVPVLIGAMFASLRGSVRGRLVWLGALYYMLYNYAFYVFVLPVTKLYLPLIAVFALSGYALITGLGNLDASGIARQFSPRTPARIVAIWMWFVALGVGRSWIGQWINYLSTGKIPELNGDQHGYAAIAAVDLSFMVSLLIPAGWWLLRRRPWGFVVGTMFGVQGTLYTAVMGAVCIVGWIAVPGTSLWSGWFIGCIVGFVVTGLCLFALLWNVKGPRMAEG